MADGPAKPVIFISYSHLDEPKIVGPEDVKWLSYVQSFLQPAAKHAAFELWTDEDIPGGAEWETRIKEKLAACDICILLVSVHSLNSPYCIDVEIDTIKQRQARGHDVKIYPIILRPIPKAALAPVRHLNLRPKDGAPLSGFPTKHLRDEAMSGIADEIARMLGAQVRFTADRKSVV